MQVTRAAVAGQDDLPALLVQGVDGVKQFVEGSPFAAEELDIVDQQDIDRAVLLAKARQSAAIEGVEEFGRELLGGESQGSNAAGVAAQVLHHGILKVGFANSGWAEKQQRAELARLLGNGFGGSISEFVGFADDEVGEGGNSLYACGEFFIFGLLQRSGWLGAGNWGLGAVSMFFFARLRGSIDVVLEGCFVAGNFSAGGGEGVVKAATEPLHFEFGGAAHKQRVVSPFK